MGAVPRTRQKVLNFFSKITRIAFDEKLTTMSAEIS
jgi:hypothetical protein